MNGKSIGIVSGVAMIVLAAVIVVPHFVPSNDIVRMAGREIRALTRAYAARLDEGDVVAARELLEIARSDEMPRNQVAASILRNRVILDGDEDSEKLSLSYEDTLRVLDTLSAATFDRSVKKWRLTVGPSPFVGVWSMKGSDVADVAPAKGFPCAFELCGDGTMNDCDDTSSNVYLSWEKDKGRLMFTAAHEGLVGEGVSIPEKVTVTFSYSLCGTELTLSDMVVSATVSGRELSRSGERVTYTKSPDTQRPRITVDRNPAIHLQCVNLDCGEILIQRYYDFTLDERHKLAIPASPLRDAEDGWSPRLRCETCRDIMGRMIQCTNSYCLKWYLDPAERDEAAGEKTCPHCN